MFDAVRNSKKIVQIFLALITLPFAFFGIVQACHTNPELFNRSGFFLLRRYSVCHSVE